MKIVIVFKTGLVKGRFAIKRLCIINDTLPNIGSNRQRQRSEAVLLLLS